jgi:hypothetical protein
MNRDVTIVTRDEVCGAGHVVHRGHSTREISTNPRSATV